MSVEHETGNAIAVDSKTIDVLINNTVSLSSDITSSLHGMENIMSELSNCLEGEVADSIKSKFAELSLNFPTIIENIESYVNDLKVLNTQFDIQQSSITLGEVEKYEGGEIINVKD